ncbi:hypothetical protein D3C76_1578040 [compost metagenome]
MPEHILGTDIMQHPVSNRDDQAGLFGNRNEFRRRNEPVFRVLPAQQRLKADCNVHQRVPFRLIDNNKFRAGQRFAQILLQRHPPQLKAVHLLIEHTEFVLAGVF